MLRFLPALGLLAGCVAPVATVSGGPASASAPTTPLAVSAAPLAPVEAPDLPAALRPSDPTHSGMEMDHVGMEMNHSGMEMDHSEVDDAPIRPVLDAYLVLHDALVADRLAPDAAQALAAALAIWTETPPPGDAHFWHLRATDASTLRRSADALAEAAGLEAARAAFGALSVPFASLVEAHGVPEGYDLARFTCGMADAPEGGVWLQPAGDTANPYFGASMATCGREDAPTEPALHHRSMNHGGTR